MAHARGPHGSLSLSFMLVALVACRAELAGGLLPVAIGLVAGLAYATWSPANLSAVTRVLTNTVAELAAKTSLPARVDLAHPHASTT